MRAAPRAILLAEAPTSKELEELGRLPSLLELGLDLRRFPPRSALDLSLLPRVERFSLLVTAAPQAPLLDAFLDVAPVVELRHQAEGGTVSAELRRSGVTLDATSRTPRFWDFARLWLRWLVDAASPTWGNVRVELDGRPRSEQAWRALAAGG